MENACAKCPYFTGYVDMGCCPHCRCSFLRMNVHNHTAVCRFCGIEVGIPMIVFGLCQTEEEEQVYKIFWDSGMKNAKISSLAKYLNEQAVPLFKRIKENVPTELELSYLDACFLKIFLEKEKIGFYAMPELPNYDKYPEFKKCWKERL